MTQEIDASVPDESAPDTPLEDSVYIDDSFDDSTDESQDEPEIDAEVTDEQLTEAAEPVEEVESETDEGDDPNPKPEQESDSPPEVDRQKPGTPDKNLQKLQQRQSAYEQASNAKMEQILQLLTDRQDAASADPKDDESPVDATEAEQSDEFEEAMAELNALAEDQDEFDELSRADLAKLAAAQAKVFKAMRNTQGKPVEIDGLDEVKAYIQREQQQKQATEGWNRFKEEKGYDGQPVWQESLEQAAEVYPDESDRSDMLKLAEKYFAREVDKMDASPPSTSKPTGAAAKPKKTAVPPASSKTRKPATGTQTTPSGAAGAGRNTAGKSDFRVWIPD